MTTVNLTSSSAATLAGHILRRLAGLTSEPGTTDFYEYKGIAVVHGLTQGGGLTSK